MKQLFNRVVVGVLGGAMLLAPSLALAEDSNATNGSSVAQLRHQLKRGSQGEDTALLQSILAADAEVYPEGLVTGLYGGLTAKAVARFQKKHNLEQVGNVGPKTLKKLNEFLSTYPIVVQAQAGASTTATSTGSQNGKAIGKGKSICAAVPPGHLVAPGWLRKHGGTMPIVPECQKLPPGIEKLLGRGGHGGGNGTSTPDTAAPVLSSIAVSGTTNTAATITWLTNEQATGKVYFSTTSPANAVSGMTTGTLSLSLAHSFVLSSLLPSTTYYFIVESKDASGNTATSSQMSFTTSANPDTTAPSISGISVGAIGSTTATVLWTTNEAATSKVYFGTTTPFVLGSASSVTDAALLLSHNLVLGGLTASTTYTFVIESKDAANNTATTSQSSFTTGN